MGMRRLELRVASASLQSALLSEHVGDSVGIPAVVDVGFPHSLTFRMHSKSLVLQLVASAARGEISGRKAADRGSEADACGEVGVHEAFGRWSAAGGISGRKAAD